MIRIIRIDSKVDFYPKQPTKLPTDRDLEGKCVKEIQRGAEITQKCFEHKWVKKGLCKTVQGLINFEVQLEFPIFLDKKCKYEGF